MPDSTPCIGTLTLFLKIPWIASFLFEAADPLRGEFDWHIRGLFTLNKKICSIFSHCENIAYSEQRGDWQWGPLYSDWLDFMQSTFKKIKSEWFTSLYCSGIVSAKSPKNTRQESFSYITSKKRTTVICYYDYITVNWRKNKRFPMMT